MRDFDDISDNANVLAEEIMKILLQKLQDKKVDINGISYEVERRPGYSTGSFELKINGVIS